MQKRPKFEELNYPPVVDNGVRTWSFVTLGIIAVLVLAYFGYYYWWQCSDFGFFKFCSMVQKPH